MSTAHPPVRQSAIHALVQAARDGDARVIARMPSGWAMFGERQFLPGYALLLPDPVVADIHSLAQPERTQFLIDMTELGAALLAVSGALRINYAIFGNLEPALHAHVVPRYADEPAALRIAHPWAYDWDAARKYERAVDAPLQLALRAELARRGAR
jgi:diadenosine tetraphosphate (Ap4A) HIT family hydrolase